MTLEDLSITVDNETPYGPVTVVTDLAYVITVTNFGLETATNVGLYLQPETFFSDVDNLPDYPPDTDYQDFLQWGEEVAAGIESAGGITLSYTDRNSVLQNARITRTVGSDYFNRVIFKDLAPNESTTIVLTVQMPTSLLSSRRAYVNLAVGM